MPKSTSNVCLELENSKQEVKNQAGLLSELTALNFQQQEAVTSSKMSVEHFENECQNLREQVSNSSSESESHHEPHSDFQLFVTERNHQLNLN